MKESPTKRMPENKAKDGSYIPNPISITVNGIERLFRYAKPLAITFLIMSVIFFIFSNLGSDPAAQEMVDDSQYSQSDSLFANDVTFSVASIILMTLLGLTLLAGIVMLIIIVSGLTDRAAAASAKGQVITFKEALDDLFDNLWNYTKLRLLVFGKTLLWTLLFILPGIYFGIRYTLAGVVFFAEGKRGNAAVKESLALTKNAWLTTFASHGLLNLITFGMIDMLVSCAANSELYRLYRGTLDSHRPQPRAHWLSWAFIALLLIAAAFVIFVFAALSTAIMNHYLYQGEQFFI